MKSNDRVTETKYRDSSTESVSYRVVVAVADETGTRTIDLPPLYESIEPDALDELVERGDSNLVVSFPFAGHEVVVRGDGTVEIG